MKKPPSASARPPIHTTQRVPSRSSKPGASAGAARGGGASAPVLASSGGGETSSVTSGGGASGTASAWGTSGGGAAEVVADASAHTSAGISGGCTGRCARNISSSELSRRRSSAAWLEALIAMMKAMIAMISAKTSNGPSDIKPPGNRRGGGGHAYLRVAPGALAQNRARAGADHAYLGLAPGAYAQARRGSLLKHVATEAVERRRTSARLCRHHPGRFDQGFHFDQAAEILFVQVSAGDRLHRILQFGKCEFGGQKFKDHRTILQFCTQSRDRCRKNPAVVEAHGCAERGQRLAR